jgi:hypothetical protein
MLSKILRRFVRVPLKDHDSFYFNAWPRQLASSKRFLSPPAPEGVQSNFQHGPEDRALVWAYLGAHWQRGEVCTGLPQGALAILVPFCYISSVCAVLA